MSSKSKDPKKGKKKGAGKAPIKTHMHALEKRLLLDASTLAATVNAIPNAVLHLDAQDLDGDDDYTDQPATGTDIDFIEDKAGGNNDASQGTASRRPSYDANAFGTGIGGLVFDGTETLDIGTQTGINNGGPWPEKSFAVTFRTGSDTSGFQVIYEQGGSIRGYQVSIDAGNIYAAGYNNTGSEWGQDRFKIMNLGAVQANTTYTVIMVFDATVGNGYIKANLNGGEFLQLDEVGDQPNHIGAIGIGAEIGGTVQPSTLNLTNNTDTNFFKGALGQIISWNHALTDNEIDAVQAYLDYKWTRKPSVQLNTGDTIPEGGTSNITSSMLYTVDSNTAAADLTYQVTGLTNGVVQRNGVTLSIGQTFTQADIDNNLITFVHDDTDTITADFSFRVTDGGSQDTDTFVLTITPVNDAGNDSPIITANTAQSVTRGGTVNITSSDLYASDPDTSTANRDYTVISTSNGVVQRSGVTVTSFDQSDIDAGLITFVHDNTYTGSAGFEFSVNDGPNTIYGTKNITITFPDTGANDPPVVSVNTGAQLNTGGTHNLSNTNLKTIDPDNNINQIVYTITSMTNGVVSKSGSNLTVGSTFTQAEINYGIISFTHDGSATTSASFGFNVTDGNTNVTGNSYDFGIVVNNAPDLGATPAPISIPENLADGTLVTTISAFDAEGDSLTYTIESGNALGVFQINPITGALTIVDNSNLNYESVTQFNLVIRATDDGIGTPYDEYTLTINVSNVSEEPSGADNTVTVLEDGTYTFSVADFGFSDTENPDDNFYSVIIDSLPSNGSLELSGVAVTAGQEILVADIPNLTFEPAANEHGTGYADFTFRVKDDGGQSMKAADLWKHFHLDEGTGTTAGDTNGGTENFDINNGTWGVRTGPDGGVSLEFDGTGTGATMDTVTFGGAVTISAWARFDDLSGGNWQRVYDFGNGASNNVILFGQMANTDDVRFEVWNGGTQTTLDIANVIVEGEWAYWTTSVALDGTMSVYKDGVLVGSTTGATLNTVARANNYIGDSNWGGDSTLDGGIAEFSIHTDSVDATAASDLYANAQNRFKDVDTSQSANTMTIDVTSVNDEPAGADNTIGINEDVPYTMTVADFGFTEKDNK